MDIKVYPTALCGNVSAPASKSITHRLLIAAFLSEQEVTINNYLDCDDTRATIKILKQLGAIITINNNSLTISRGGTLDNSYIYDCSASGSTARFMIPVISLFTNDFYIKGVDKLIERLITHDLYDLEGLVFHKINGLHFKGSLNANKYFLSMINTTQWISGMIYALPFISGKFIQIEDGKLTNSYIQMTLKAMETFGFHYQCRNDTIHFLTKKDLKTSTVSVEGDYSNASYLLNMQYLNPDVRITNLSDESLQGDAIYKSYLELLRSKNQDVHFDLSSNPDLGPALFAISCVSEKRVTITGIHKLFLKESNRINSMIVNLTKLGADIFLEDQKVIINGKSHLEGDASVDSFNDHRVVMSLISIASRVKKPFIITNSQAINKSYPEFFNDFKSISGKVEEVK